MRAAASGLPPPQTRVEKQPFPGVPTPGSDAHFASRRVGEKLMKSLPRNSDKSSSDAPLESY